MTTQFETFEGAKKYGAFCAGVDIGTMMTEDPDLKVCGAGGFLEPDLQQRGFRFKNAKGEEVGIVIGPFRDGYDLWLISLDGGMSVRV